MSSVPQTMFFRPRVERLEARELLNGGAATDHLRAAYAQLPLSFEANRGQADAQVRFLARGTGYALYLTADEAVLSLQKPAAATAADAVLRMRLVGARPAPAVTGLDERPGTINYFTGADPAGWQAGVSTYGKVRYHDVYAGIDVDYYGRQRQLEYDFLVAPGADPGVIRMAYQGADQLRLDAAGNLIIDTTGGEVIHHAPVLYQDGAGGRRAVSGHYALAGPDQVGFVVGAYDPSRPLVIDPVLSYSTYLGGSDTDVGTSIALDPVGNAYVAGTTHSTDFPTVGAWQGSYGGGSADAFVTKLDPSGNLVYSTYLGGNQFDGAAGIAVDQLGNAYVTGSTAGGFPITNGSGGTVPAFQPTYGGGAFDAYVARLNAFGQLVFSSYLGGAGDDRATAIAVDGSGDAYVTGSTTGRFPITPGAYQSTFGGGLYDACVASVDTNFGIKNYATYLGGRGDYDWAYGIAVEPTCRIACAAYVTGFTDSPNFPTTSGAFQTSFGGGYDAFVTKVHYTGSTLIYSTYLGGAGYDRGTAIAVDAAGSAYVTGFTDSPDFPVTPGALQGTSGGDVDAFVAKLHYTGRVLSYSTYLGGSQREYGLGIAVDAAGFAYVTGWTSSPNFPVTFTNTYQPGFAGGASDAFVTEVNPLGTALVMSTYLGGSGDEGTDNAGIAVDPAGCIYVVGYTNSTDFPSSNAYGGGSSDAFVSKLCDCLQQSPSDLFNTGVDDGGNPLPTGTTDGHYTVVTAPQPAYLGTPFAANLAPGIWPPDGPTYAWIVPPTSVGNEPNGIYVFETFFTLPPGTIPGSAVLFGSWAADDFGLDILLNGNSTGNTTTRTGYRFVVTGAQAGLNSLDFVVQNAGGGPTGIQVNMRLAVCPCSGDGGGEPTRTAPLATPAPLHGLVLPADGLGTSSSHEGRPASVPLPRTAVPAPAVPEPAAAAADRFFTTAAAATALPGRRHRELPAFADVGFADLLLPDNGRWAELLPET